MITSQTFVKNVLPGGVVPTDATLGDDAYKIVQVPFAVLRWDDGKDYDLDGNAYQDSPPEWYLAGAFDARDDAERFVAEGDDMVLEPGRRFQLYEFTGAYVRQQG
jgi:hypothetical protein